MSDSSFVLGFIAGEGCFTVDVNKGSYTIYLQPRFKVVVDSKDRDTLLNIREVIGGVGNVNEHSDGSTHWDVSSKGECQHVRDYIREHGGKLWLDTDKAENFEVWADIVDIHEVRSDYVGREQMAELARDLNKGSGGRERDWDSIIEQI